VDSLSNSVYFNPTYSFRLPHETNLKDSKIKYARRYERFMNYRNSDENFLFIRQINKGRYNIPKEELDYNYNDDNYEKVLSILPKNSVILLIIHTVLPPEEKNKISNKFIVLDDVINPEHIAYGDYLHHKNNIIKYYNQLFDYINKNFNHLNVNTMKEFVKNERIGIIH